MRLRSMLFVPGDQPRKIEKALAELPADAVILDLEDAVAIDLKLATRAPVAAAVDRPRKPPAEVRRTVWSAEAPPCGSTTDLL